MLAEEDIVLLDVRSEESREKDGVPELKFAARFKAAVLPLATVVRELQSVPMSQVRHPLFFPCFMCGMHMNRIIWSTYVFLLSFFQMKSRDELILDVAAALVQGLKVTKGPLSKVRMCV